MRRTHCLAVSILATLLFLVPANSGALLLGQDSDTTRPELANFDVFLDGHPDIAQQLKQNPSLVNSEEFLENHPALQQYLQNHPKVREELQENPRVFMKGEERFDKLEAARGDNDIRGRLARFDNFLDNHPEIAQQLSKDPSLINNEEYIEKHPELQQFLKTHPGVREELTENPRAFMQAEARFERGDNDVTRGELARFDRFLDSHPAIAQELASNPSLVNNEEYMENHPELQQFLKTHSGVTEELKENPGAFMQAEARFDNPQTTRGDNDTTRGELASFDSFLDKHPAIAQQLSKDPSLVNNEEYVENHPELQQFLKTHAGLREELRENPQAFMNAEGSFEGHEHVRIAKMKKKHATQSPDKQ